MERNDRHDDFVPNTALNTLAAKAFSMNLTHTTRHELAKRLFTLAPVLSLMACGGGDQANQAASPQSITPTEVASVPSSDLSDEVFTSFAKSLVLPNEVRYFRAEYVDDSNSYQLLKAYEEGKKILIDGTKTAPTVVANLTKMLTGLGAEGSVAVLQKGKSNNSVYQILQRDEEDSSIENSQTPDEDAFREAVIAALAEPPRTMDPEERKVQGGPISGYIPIKTLPLVTLRKPSISCRFSDLSYFNSGKLYDADSTSVTNTLQTERCDKAYISLDFKVEYMRSDSAIDSTGISTTGKMVRISLVTGSQGSGFGLAPQLGRNRVGNGPRYESTGPLAETYGVSMSTDSSKVRLLAHAPASANPKTSYSSSSTVTVGVRAGAYLVAGSGGLGFKAEVIPSFSVSSQQSYSVAVQDYTLANRSNSVLSQAWWEWERNSVSRLCREATYPSTNSTSDYCWLNAVGTDPSRIYNDMNVSAISYANFQPNVSATFVTRDLEESGVAVPFNISAGMNITMIKGIHSGITRRLVTTPVIRPASINTRFTVDFTDPAFQSGPTYRIRSNNIQAPSGTYQCLRVIDAPGARLLVTVGDCSTSTRHAQWGYTEFGQLESRYKPGHCIHAGINGSREFWLKACDKFDTAQKINFDTAGKMYFLDADDAVVKGKGLNHEPVNGSPKEYYINNCYSNDYTDSAPCDKSNGEPKSGTFLTLALTALPRASNFAPSWTLLDGPQAVLSQVR